MSPSQRIDPYRQILGIPPEEQPPNYYRLLGLARFEGDVEEIRRAAQLRAKLITVHRQGPLAKYCDDLLYVIHTARTCLLDARLKASYDRKLQGQLRQASKSGPASAQPNATAGTPAETAFLPLEDDTIDLFADDDFDAVELREPPSARVDATGELPRKSAKKNDSPLTPESTSKTVGSGPPTAQSPGHTRPSASPSGNSKKPSVFPEFAEFPDPTEASLSPEPPLAAPVSTPEVASTNGHPHEPHSIERNPVEATAVERRADAAHSPPRRRPTRGIRVQGAPLVAASVSPEVPWVPDDAGYEVVGAADSDPLISSPIPPVAADSSSAALTSHYSSLINVWRVAKSFLLTAATLLMVSVTSLVVWVGYVAPESSAHFWELVAPVREPSSARGETRFPRRTSSLPSRSQIAPNHDGEVIGAVAGPMEIGIACGTEKREWLEEAVSRFEETDDGLRFHVRLFPMESMVGSRVVVAGDARLDVWAPASSLYEDVFRRDWAAKYYGEQKTEDPILQKESLALTPMVVLMWKSRYDALREKVPNVSIETLEQAMRTPTGWDTIAGHAEWGRFKFAHTNPARSNAGLASLLVIAYGFEQASEELTLTELMSPGFQTHLLQFEKDVVRTPDSTERMIRDMILRGPTEFDAVVVYESTAIDAFEEAAGRWEPLTIVYPENNLWNDHPYYILNAPWSTPERQAAAAAFLKFLMSEPIQRLALEHGFRPGNEKVPIRFPESPFVRYESSGVKVDIPSARPFPPADVIECLQQTWLRNTGK